MTELIRFSVAPRIESAAPPLKDELQSAEAEVASLYYQSSLSSLAAPLHPPTEKHQQAIQAVDEKKKSESIIQKMTDWLWSIVEGAKSLIGLKKKEPEISEEDFSPSDPYSLDHAPFLTPPERLENKKLAAALADLNRELVYRLKEMAEFEEELLKASSNQLDKMIFHTLVFSSLAQKKLKELLGTLDQEEIFRLQQKNKDLQKTFYLLETEILKRAKTNKILHWINVGSTAGIMAVFAATVATGGALFMLKLATPLFGLVKGVASFTEGVLKHQNEKTTGELFIVNQEIKKNSTQMNDNLNGLQTNDEEISALLKTIRHHLDNQSRAERVFSRN